MTNWEYFVVNSDKRTVSAIVAYRRWLEWDTTHRTILEQHGPEQAFLKFLREYSPACEWKAGDIVEFKGRVGIVQNIHYTNQRGVNITFADGKNEDQNAEDLKIGEIPGTILALAKQMVKDEMAGSCPLKEPTCLKK